MSGALYQLPAKAGLRVGTQVLIGGPYDTYGVILKVIRDYQLPKRCVVTHPRRFGLREKDIVRAHGKEDLQLYLIRGTRREKPNKKPNKIDLFYETLEVVN